MSTHYLAIPDFPQSHARFSETSVISSKLTHYRETPEHAHGRAAVSYPFNLNIVKAVLY